jgi:hypothetical protein
VVNKQRSDQSERSSNSEDSKHMQTTVESSKAPPIYLPTPPTHPSPPCPPTHPHACSSTRARCHAAPQTSGGCAHKSTQTPTARSPSTPLCLRPSESATPAGGGGEQAADRGRGAAGRHGSQENGVDKLVGADGWDMGQGSRELSQRQSVGAAFHKVDPANSRPAGRRAGMQHRWRRLLAQRQGARHGSHLAAGRADDGAVFCSQPDVQV